MSLPPNDIDPQETREWRESLQAVIAHDGPERARFLLSTLLEQTRGTAAETAAALETPYVNTLPAAGQPAYPGDLETERRLLALLRWNAMAIVARANKREGSIGGHIATYQSVAHLFEVGLHHFFRAPTEEDGGDLVFLQGHASPGIYARAFLEGRLEESHLEQFRREVDGGGISSYPHSWLMPDFWQQATVSMGLGPLMAIYQARFMKYLEQRGLRETHGRKVWAFLGDGEMDEPESLGALSVASREGLDNLIFVVNCNLQRLDGPVRGNGKIIQELERVFRGAGWNVLKVIWSGDWDALLAADHDGRLRQMMMETLDGEYQNHVVHGGGRLRERFFGADPELAARVAHLSDEQLAGLRRGGHDPEKIHAAYAAAVAHRGQPTVILAKTVKGFGMGSIGEGRNTTHNQKKMPEHSVRAFRERFDVPADDPEELPFLRPDGPEVRYLKERRAALGGPFPQRRLSAPALATPALDVFKTLLGGSGEKEMSTTMAFVRALSLLLRQRQLAPHLVPILADEARTFGMEGLFRQIGIYAPHGQLYEPVDSDQLMSYREAVDGQILQEGINEAGALSSWIAAGTSYSHHGLPMVPLYIFYSMFGFQRVMDLIWAAADMRCRGFLLGATAGRTTLNGEGLQHQDGHSHLLASAVPSCISYDPTFGYELAVILQDGLRRMYRDDESVFYYITLMNENYAHLPMPEGAEEGIRRGLYLLRPNASKSRKKPRVQLLGCGTILTEVLAAAELLEEQFGVLADVWSATSFNELQRDGAACERWNRLHPGETPRASFVEQCLGARQGPVVAATDYVRAYADQIRRWVPGTYTVLGTDGYGRSDTRQQLRRFFEVDRQHIAVAALSALAEAAKIEPAAVRRAIEDLGIDPERVDPTTV